MVAGAVTFSGMIPCDHDYRPSDDCTWDMKKEDMAPWFKERAEGIGKQIEENYRKVQEEERHEARRVTIHGVAHTGNSEQPHPSIIEPSVVSGQLGVHEHWDTDRDHDEYYDLFNDPEETMAATVRPLQAKAEAVQSQTSHGDENEGLDTGTHGETSQVSEEVVQDQTELPRTSKNKRQRDVNDKVEAGQPSYKRSKRLVRNPTSRNKRQSIGESLTPLDKVEARKAQVQGAVKPRAVPLAREMEQGTGRYLHPEHVTNGDDDTDGHECKGKEPPRTVAESLPPEVRRSKILREVVGSNEAGAGKGDAQECEEVKKLKTPPVESIPEEMAGNKRRRIEVRGYQHVNGNQPDKPVRKKSKRSSPQLHPNVETHAENEKDTATEHNAECDAEVNTVNTVKI